MADDITFSTLLRDESFPYWGKDVISTVETKDMVDVLNVLETLIVAAKVRLVSIQRTNGNEIYATR
jgi:hypothetical protein